MFRKVQKTAEFPHVALIVTILDCTRRDVGQVLISRTVQTWLLHRPSTSRDGVVPKLEDVSGQRDVPQTLFFTSVIVSPVVCSGERAL